MLTRGTSSLIYQQEDRAPEYINPFNVYLSFSTVYIKYVDYETVWQFQFNKQ